MEDKKTKIQVSDLFVHMYENFNVITQKENIAKLTKRELYLLITICIDSYLPDPGESYGSTAGHAGVCEIDNVVKFNFSEFDEEMINEIFDTQSDLDIKNGVLKSLIEETGYKYIYSKNIIDIVDKDNNKLREPLTKQEVREAKINIIQE